MITTILQLNSVGREVMILQRALQELGHGQFIPTGFFGSKTREAVMSFQKDKKLSVTGTVDSPTRVALNEYLANKPSDALYNLATAFIGYDASPADMADDEVGCADSVSNLLVRCYGKTGLTYTLSTADMYRQMRNSDLWRQVSTPSPGAIVISPTGYGNGTVVGHVGICGVDDKIMSNSSATGKWSVNFTQKSWKARYVTKGALPMVYFKKL